jgi:hypothetical protein
LSPSLPVTFRQTTLRKSIRLPRSGRTKAGRHAVRY